jgi:hypothetical protein
MWRSPRCGRRRSWPARPRPATSRAAGLTMAGAGVAPASSMDRALLPSCCRAARAGPVARCKVTTSQPAAISPLRRSAAGRAGHAGDPAGRRSTATCDRRCSGAAAVPASPRTSTGTGRCQDGGRRRADSAARAARRAGYTERSLPYLGGRTSTAPPGARGTCRRTSRSGAGSRHRRPAALDSRTPTTGNGLIEGLRCVLIRSGHALTHEHRPDGGSGRRVWPGRHSRRSSGRGAGRPYVRHWPAQASHKRVERSQHGRASCRPFAQGVAGCGLPPLR